MDECSGGDKIRGRMFQMSQMLMCLFNVQFDVLGNMYGSLVWLFKQT